MRRQTENRIDSVFGIGMTLRKKPCFAFRRNFIPHTVIHMNQPERGTRRQRVFRILADNPRIHRDSLRRFFRRKSQRRRAVKSLRHKTIPLLRSRQELLIQFIGGSLHEKDIVLLRFRQIQFFQFVHQRKGFVRLLCIERGGRGKVKRPRSQCGPFLCDFTINGNIPIHFSVCDQHLADQKFSIRLRRTSVIRPDQLLRLPETVAGALQHTIAAQSLPFLFRRRIDIGVDGFVKLKRTFRIAGLLQQTRRIEFCIGTDQ